MENNIGKLNEIFMQNISNLYLKKNGVKIIKEYVSLFKKNKSLLKEFLVFEYIENQEPSDNLKDFIMESVNYLNNVEKKELLTLNSNLSKFLTKHKIEKISEIKNEKLFEDIHDLIFAHKSLKMINEKVKKINNIVKYINEKKIVIEENCLPSDLDDSFYNILINNFNKRYSDNLTEEQKEIFKKIISLESEKDKSSLFENERKECLQLTNKVLKEHIDQVTKEKLLDVKEKLLEQQYYEDSYIKDIISLLDLKQTLTN